MGRENVEPELPTPAPLLDEFLKDYYYLFALVSVFGVIGVYPSALQAQEIYGNDLRPLLDIAVVASLTLFVIVSAYIDFIVVFVYTNELTTPTAVVSKRNPLLAFFLVPFDVLVLALVVLLARAELAVYFVVNRVSFGGGILVYEIVSPRLFSFFNWLAESGGHGSFLGLVAFDVYTVRLVAGAVLVLPAMFVPMRAAGRPEYECLPLTVSRRTTNRWHRITESG